MADWCIVVADASRARVFTAKLGDGTRAAELTEREDLVEPESGLTDREIFSDRSGQNRPGSGFEEHRAKHRLEVERRFAKRVAGAVARRIRGEPSDALVVVASPRFLGLLRVALAAALPGMPPRVEVGANLTGQALARLEKSLTKLGILPTAPFTARRKTRRSLRRPVAAR